MRGNAEIVHGVVSVVWGWQEGEAKFIHINTHRHAHTHTLRVWLYLPVRKRLIRPTAVRLKRGLTSSPLHSFSSPPPFFSPVARVCVHECVFA